MTSPALPLLATSELVAASWIGSIPGLSPGMVATQLPKDDTTWAATGFVTVGPVVGGTPHPDLPVKKPVIQVDCYATKPGSDKPPWWKANVLAETIRYAAWQRKGFNRVLTLTAGNVTYPPAVVQGVYLTIEPRRIPGDPGDYARYEFEMALSWITVNDRLT